MSLSFGLQSGAAVTESEAVGLNYPTWKTSPSRSNCCTANTWPDARLPCRRYKATTIVRYLDNQGRALRQLEIYDEHADLIIRREQHGGAVVRDFRAG